MKKVLLLTAVLAMILALFAGCGETSTTVPEQGTQQPSNETQNVVKYTVTFANTDMQATQVEAGKTLSKPADPKKTGSLFVGWYADAALTQKVEFPLTISSDTTIYADYYSYQDAFVKARNNTIGKSVPGYEYDYTLSASATYMGVALNGNTVGNAKYNPALTDVTFYDEHENSGALFYDGTKYSMKKALDLHKISLDETES